MARRVDGVSRREERKKEKIERNTLVYVDSMTSKIRAQVQNQAVTTALNY